MIFNEKKFLARQKQVQTKARTCEFLIYAASDLLHRLKYLNLDSKKILILNDASHNLKNNIIKEIKCTRLDEVFTISAFSDVKYDLVISSMSMHFVNDTRNYLKLINDSLDESGIFIANFVGGASLKSLRLKLIEVEDSLNKAHYPHISPFIKFDDIPSLLKITGFEETITDYEKIQLECESAYELMKNIKRIGQSNCLIAASPYGISKKMLQILMSKKTTFEDEVTLISFIAAKNKNTIKIKNHE